MYTTINCYYWAYIGLQLRSVEYELFDKTEFQVSDKSYESVSKQAQVWVDETLKKLAVKFRNAKEAPTEGNFILDHHDIYDIDPQDHYIDIRFETWLYFDYDKTKNYKRKIFFEARTQL